MTKGTKATFLVLSTRPTSGLVGNTPDQTACTQPPPALNACPQLRRSPGPCAGGRPSLHALALCPALLSEPSFWPLAPGCAPAFCTGCSWNFLPHLSPSFTRYSARPSPPLRSVSDRPGQVTSPLQTLLVLHFILRDRNPHWSGFLSRSSVHPPSSSSCLLDSKVCGVRSQAFFLSPSYHLSNCLQFTRIHTS